MNIDEAREAKTELESRIANLLREFTEKTSLTVTSVDIEQWYSVTQYQAADYSISIGAQLDSLRDQHEEVIIRNEIERALCS